MESVELGAVMAGVLVIMLAGLSLYGVSIAIKLDGINASALCGIIAAIIFVIGSVAYAVKDIKIREKEKPVKEAKTKALEKYKAALYSLTTIQFKIKGGL